MGAAGGYIFSWKDGGGKHAPPDPDQPPPYTQQDITDLEKAIRNSVDVHENVSAPPLLAQNFLAPSGDSVLGMFS